MDVDRFIATNQPAWDRLNALTRRAGRGLRRLTAAELDELVRLYQRVSTHLSLARTTYREPALTASLTGLTAQAGAVVYGTRPRTVRALSTFFTTTFPAALWQARWFVAVATAVFTVPAVAVAIWIGGSPQTLDAVMSPEDQQQYLESDFESYYSENPSAQFAATVTSNNIRVGILAFVAGIAFCVPSFYVLVLNGANLGVAAGLFGSAGELPRFFSLILPHGLLELTAVFVAGAAGLRLGWTLIDPGDRPRGAALTEEGRRTVTLVLGLVAVFGVAGLIEGFVTGSALPVWVRVGTGAVAWAAFLLYAVVLGRAASERGYTGALGEHEESGWVRRAG